MKTAVQIWEWRELKGESVRGMFTAGLPLALNEAHQRPDAWLLIHDIELHADSKTHELSVGLPTRSWANSEVKYFVVSVEPEHAEKQFTEQILEAVKKFLNLNAVAKA